LKDFLKAVLGLPDSEFEKITIVDPHLRQEGPADKLGILDVKVETASGSKLAIEIQVKNVREMRPRICYYLANMLTDQLGPKAKYTELKRAICIVITDFSLVTESEKCHTTFQMREVGEHFPFSDLLEIDVLDLTKTSSEKNKNLANWLNFIRAEREEEFEMAAQASPVIQEAYTYLRELSADEEARLLYEARLKAQRDEWSRLDEALEKGEAKGRAEGEAHGLAKGKAEVARNLARLGMDVEMISKATGLDAVQIDEILSEIAAD
jgi:predicted transposase/invertase (TIGR01784 family)